MIPAWLIVPPANLSNFVGAWHDSQGWLVGTWVAGGGLGTPLTKLVPAAWQVAQPPAIPACDIA